MKTADNVAAASAQRQARRYSVPRKLSYTTRASISTPFRCDCSTPTITGFQKAIILYATLSAFDGLSWVGHSGKFSLKGSGVGEALGQGKL